MIALHVSDSSGGEKEELQWKARALIAESAVSKLQSDLGQCRGGHQQQAIQDFIKEIDQKGFMATQDGNIVEKPKPVVPPKKEDSKTPPK